MDDGGKVPVIDLVARRTVTRGVYAANWFPRGIYAANWFPCGVYAANWFIVLSLPAAFSAASPAKYSL